MSEHAETEHKSKILLVYTGGTIGMMKKPETGALVAFNFDKLLTHIPELRQLTCEIDAHSFDEPIDSSNMDVAHWIQIGDVIAQRYDDYDGFVVLHGSDTMSYTGSALSFMFDNLAKPIILTGSQLPIGDLRTDAKENLITSIQLAALWEDGAPVIQEVGLYFEYKLYRANRTSKVNAHHFEAFASPNYDMLAESGVELRINYPRLMRPRGILVYRKQFVAGVSIVHLFPGLPVEHLRHAASAPGIKAIILMTYGSGNAPTNQSFIKAIQELIAQGVHIINVSQCEGGSVDMSKYETGSGLLESGVISGRDITIEAAVSKAMFLLAQNLEVQGFKDAFELPLVGEMS